AALPRLREMLSEQNVNVVDIDVSQHSFAEQRDQQASNSQDGKGHVSNLDGELEESVFDQQENTQQRQYNGLFSDFA
ncbi:flagellar hook-length control-like protein, partial [Cycloclasticus sp. 44_32_T64]